MANYSFPPTSRYYNIAIETLTAADGVQTPYLSRRFLPQSDQFALLRAHTVGQGERMDLIAAGELGDAEAFWRICDANDAMRPDDLTAVIGRRLRITLPLGIPGMPNN
jgi:hypothetical protein